ncbi:hypothetical protein U8527_15765 [Kordia algicida OT-1]|uniref:Uncharacterized protein n=1 Tax=Kordia algicida OT-1 TaxID=391587 RepID=A9E3V4_9FLAO|nr:hypothetical protein [Kordia algicida]EDP95275.1 hypothetical protein KAOT1_09391 [Kordia algicida OT-1]
MKKKTKRTLQFAKISVAAIQTLDAKGIKGGTEPVSPPMSQAPDDQTVCYAIK